ncbi:MAG TPA: histidinol dehydrogenase, partial [Myxococcaceae bacterium]|nr:histidinol dehydrogenase [Myxococcaceae bacterium]
MNFDIAVHALEGLTAEQRARFMNRAQADIDRVRGEVSEIIRTVRSEGDAALVHYTRQFDDPAYTLERLRVTPAEV